MNRHKSNYIKEKCPDCGREVIVTERQKNKQCQQCYNKSHKYKLYYRGGDVDENKE